MVSADLEAVKLLFQKCLDNAEALLDSAKDARSKKRNHIAFHLAVLALEEIGKAAMIVADKVYPHVAGDEDMGDSDDRPRLSDDIADHRKKLFWAMLSLQFNTGVFSPQDFIQLKEIANDIHVRRVGSLYTNVDEMLPEVDIPDDQLERIIGLTECRLNLEKLREFRKLDSDAQELLDWFMKALHDPLLQRFILSEQSKHKLAELGGNSRTWMTWLHDEADTAEANAKEMMEKEINRVAPRGAFANKPKWRLTIKLHTLSHSIRHKQLNAWNDQSIWVKLRPTAKKTELLVDFLLPAQIPVTDLWPAALQLCSIFVVSLNIATVGYFWWYLPEFVSTFCEEILDIETNARLNVDYKSPVMGDWKRTSLKAQDLHIAGMIMAYLTTSATKEQSLSYSRYMQGIALLSKNDVFGDFTHQALVHFAHAFRMGLASYGEWDGVPESFESSVISVLGKLWDNADILMEFKSLMEAADALERQQEPSRPIKLPEAIKLKAFCDAYLGSRARRELQKVISQRSPKTSASSSTPPPPSE